MNRPREARRLNWLQHIESELAFWRHWFDGETPYQTEMEDRLKARAPLQQWIRDLINLPPGSTVHILDVGAGPLSILGNVWEGYDLVLEACDPLADGYNKIMDERGIIPRTRSVRCAAEELTSLFAPDSFDFVYARNCLDHAYDPLEAIRQSILVAKPGGHVFLAHYVNEAEYAVYQGLHQWNFDLQESQFIVWNQTTRYVINSESLDLPAKMDANKLTDVDGGRGWLDVDIVKEGA